MIVIVSYTLFGPPSKISLILVICLRLTVGIKNDEPLEVAVAVVFAVRYLEQPHLSIVFNSYGTQAVSCVSYLK